MCQEVTAEVDMNECRVEVFRYREGEHCFEMSKRNWRVYGKMRRRVGLHMKEPGM
jgi:hypothetical protein